MKKYDNIISVGLILFLVPLVGNVIYAFISNTGEIGASNGFGWAMPEGIRKAIGFLCGYIGLILISSYLFPKFCSLFDFIMSTGESKTYEKHPAIIISGLTGFLLGIISIFS